ncbi:MAG: hypothetical protein K2H29_05765 [Oscillospiraceae bacterium]|nr:hypothetical protein [Oscillospiraceae bacterium]
MLKLQKEIKKFNKIKILFCLILCCTFCLSGCSIGINVDTMLTPPKLSGEQEQIYQALQNAAGTGIRLKYPKSGSYLSAFIIADIDADDSDEAIVFYEKSNMTGTDGGLRINILDKVNFRWQSICDRSAEGSEIEKVIISRLGGSDKINIIVGYSTANQSEKYLSVYAYENHYLEQTLTHSYALFDVAQVDPQQHPDLVVLGAVSTSEQAYAAVYCLEEDRNYHEYKYRFTDNYTDYHQLIYGKLPGQRTALYIDAATGTANIQTEILCLEESEQKLQFVNLLQRCGKSAEETVRRAGLSCMDIDRDGVPEIPVQTMFPGYENAAEPEQIRRTDWLMMQENLIFTEYFSYYNANDGYVFLLPEIWQGNVTIRKDTTENEIQFCNYRQKNNPDYQNNPDNPDHSNQTEQTGEEMPVLLRIYIAYDEADREDHLGSGYALLHTKGSASYLVKPESGEELSLTLGEIFLNFKFLD